MGKQPVVPAAGVDQRVPVFGALDALTGRLLAHTPGRKNSAGFLEHLGQLLRAYPHRHIFLFLDNSSIHHAKVVKRFLADQADQVTVIWNAPYTPELNLIERYWGYLKAKAIHNYFFETKAALETAIWEAVCDLNRSEELRMTVHLGFLHPLHKAA